MSPEDLRDVIAAHRARLLAAYRGEEAWDEARASYGVGALGAREPELRACLEALAAWAQNAAHALGPAGTALAAHVAELVKETMSELSPPATGAKAGLSMIFANATASVGFWKEKAGKAKQAYVARCRHCGGRQMSALLFDCSYCGRFLYDPD